MAVAAPAIGVLPSIATYSAPLTPRAKASKLGFDSMAGVTVPILATRTIPASPAKPISSDTESATGGADEQGVRTSMDSVSDNDGRITPVPNPDATIRRSQAHSPRSILPPRQPSVLASSSALPNTAQAPLPANMGFGTLHGEEQLKMSLQSKDRIFVVMLSKEIEAFLQRCVAGESMDDAQAAVSQQGGASLTMFGSFPTVKIQSVGTSRFQRMLVYKVAEWYGAKAIPGPDNVIYLGLLGDMSEKSASLKLAALVPERESVQQKFKIMQRSQPVGPSRSGSAAEGGDGGPTSRKTLEQREAEYAAERERIYGSAQDTEEVSDRPTQRRVEDEIDPVSRYAYGVDTYDPMYAPYSDLSSGQIDPSQHMNGGAPYYVNQMVPYPGYQYAPVNNGYAMYTQQAYDQHGNPIMLVPQQMNGYAPMWQPQPMGNGAQQPMQTMMPPHQGGGWSHNYQQQMIMPPPTNGSLQPQPMYGYPGYPSLMHPQPTRPHPQPHSSASSSISSHSYHSRNNPSRPQSRGSTTSTRSATSSARFGQMYPPNPTYRQKGMKGVNGLTTLGIAQDRRSTRGQSPSSTTTTSSRSSRSIPVQPPGHFPLPQRPDWTKAEVEYQPSEPISDVYQSRASGSTTTLSSDGYTPGWSSGGPSGVASPMSRVVSRQPSHPSPSTTNGHLQGVPETPYRPRPSQALFDPASTPSGARSTFSPKPAPTLDGSDMSPEDIIEAKLQALSFSTGVAIGPPPVRAAPTGGPSYAKVVRRD